MKGLTKKELILVSMMLFSMFFGAGNLIFPPFLGLQAGENVWISIIGLLISAVCLPILGVVAIAQLGSFTALASRVHRSFALIFPLIIYISIGPALAIPRASSLAFESGMQPFLPKEIAMNPMVLFVYTLVFFSIVTWLCMSPSKLVDRMGKLLTPTLLIIIGMIFISSFVTPMDTFAKPEGLYQTQPVFKGFLEGYLTMDCLAALVYGIVVANAIRAKGINDRQVLSRSIINAGVGTGVLLSSIYMILAYLGAASSSIDKAENGAQVLAYIMNHLFGSYGIMILGVVFTIACLCVSIGLITSCSQYFFTIFKKISYRAWVVILSILSMAIANLGLTQIIKISGPILGLIYPVAIVLIFLGLLDRWFKGSQVVYLTTITMVALYSILEMINQTLLSKQWESIFIKLPLYTEGIGWVLPSIAAFLIGLVISKFKKNQQQSHISLKESA
ncbi:branched-chain amino acid transport system II carrier protein [Thermoflavimicrobium daqui]|uniref:Branched-chain amino acid transport system carrier protein n=1 Tax=Thermoflavimicrobium daqui TaxID=2137476 RepID=A0A364K3X7_9BACL|nr:branched-chain amino acid transport system II carrier protein [Thermoflavimicrobium daqui]RAL24065.1 branched-chain amino acid transport system II carrier protein [Thermoflavimicrobium daqui]